MIKRFAIALILVVLVCGGLVGFNLFRANAIKSFFANQQPPAVTVSATEVKPVTWSPEIAAIGTLSAIQGVDVAVQVGGVVKSINFKANDEVEQDQLLVQIDDAVERADLLSAQSSLASNQASLQRAQTLRRTGVSSEAALETAESSQAAAESALARTQATIDLKAIEAPFAGTIGIPRIEVGQYVQPATVIATLQQLRTMRVDFTVPEQRIADLSIGQDASFGLTESDTPYQGRITGIDPKIDPATRLVSVRAEVDNPGGALRPGQFVRVRVKLPEAPNVIALPQTSVVTSLYGDYVYVVGAPDPAAKTAGAAGETGPAATEKPEPAAEPAQPAAGGDTPKQVAKQVFVQLGRRQGTLIEITKGVTPGQTVVTSGQNKLSNNAPVTINNAIDPATVALGDGNGSS